MAPRRLQTLLDMEETHSGLQNEVLSYGHSSESGTDYRDFVSAPVPEPTALALFFKRAVRFSSNPPG